MEPVSGCTWKDCNSFASNHQVAEDGHEWANLCDAHHERMQRAIKNLDVKAICGMWVLAQGGSSAMADKFLGGN